MGLARRKFTKEFKLAAIQRLETGATTAEVARAFEVTSKVLYRWRDEFRRGPAIRFREAGNGAGTNPYPESAHESSRLC